VKKSNMQNQTQTQIKVGPDTIARKAYQIWEAAGRPNGRELEHWLQAEAELRAANQRSNLKFIFPNTGPGVATVQPNDHARSESNGSRSAKPGRRESASRVMGNAG
jgi:hypothetical protein